MIDGKTRTGFEYDHVAENDPDGIADVTKVNDELEDIIKAVGESEKK